MSSGVREYKSKCLISGYIGRKTTDGNDRHYPDALIVVIFEYLGNVFRIFNICPDVCMKDISKDGLSIKRGKHIEMEERPRKSKRSPRNFRERDIHCLYGCSKGFEPNTGNYTLSIKIKYLSENISHYGSDSIGIISDPSWFKKTCIDHGYYGLKLIFAHMDNIKCNSYYLTLSKTNYHKIRNGPHTKLDTESGAIDEKLNPNVNISVGDIITMHIDTDKGRLYFRKNGKKLCNAFYIATGCTYYAAIGSLTVGNEYEIVL